MTSSLAQLPDFIAVRQTDAFATVPPWPDKPHAMPVTEVHFVREHRREVAVRAGHEVAASRETGRADSTGFEGLTTWGEFGPMLATIFGDSLRGSITWSRWQNDANGTKLAVSHYTVPEAASHDLIDLCCYLGFRSTPAYHGDLSIDPESGVVHQLTLEAEFSDDAVIRVSKMAVRYGSVSIGGKTYCCPLQGVAVGLLHDDQLEKVDGVGLERFINVVHFTDYHKFGSTARILTSQ